MCRRPGCTGQTEVKNLYSIDKATLAAESERTGFIRDNLEKVYRLLDILEFIDNNELLRNTLVLKGGTAINLTIFDLPRLSVDIDLDFSRECSKTEMLEYRQEIENILGRYMRAAGYFSDVGRAKAAHSLDSGVFVYENAGGNKDNIKIEINYSMRSHVLKPELKEINFEFMQTPVSVTSVEMTELFGSKIKALLERTAARDLFDINNMIVAGLFSEPDELSMLRKCMLFYKSVGSTGPFNKAIEFDRIDDLTFTALRQTLLPVLRKSEYVDLPGMKNNVKGFLTDLIVLDEREQLYLDEFGKGRYRPDLLFDDEDIIKRIDRHPMAIWKTSKIRESLER